MGEEESLSSTNANGANGATNGTDSRASLDNNTAENISTMTSNNRGDLSRVQLTALLNIRLSMPNVKDYVFTSDDANDENFFFRCVNLTDYKIHDESPLIYLKNPHGCLFKNKVVFCCPEDDVIVLECLADHLLTVPMRNIAMAETARFLRKYTKLSCQLFLERNDIEIRQIIDKAKRITASRQLDGGDGMTPSACADSLMMKQWRHCDTNFRQIQGGQLQTHSGINQLLNGQTQVIELLKGFQAEHRAQRESNDSNLQALRESNGHNLEALRESNDNNQVQWHNVFKTVSSHNMKGLQVLSQSMKDLSVRSPVQCRSKSARRASRSPDSLHSSPEYNIRRKTTHKIAATERKGRGKGPNPVPMTPRALVTPGAKKPPGTKKKPSKTPVSGTKGPAIPSIQVRVFKRGFELPLNTRGGTCRSCIKSWNENYQFCAFHSDHLETYTQTFDGECDTLDQD